MSSRMMTPLLGVIITIITASCGLLEEDSTSESSSLTQDAAKENRITESEENLASEETPKKSKKEAKEKKIRAVAFTIVNHEDTDTRYNCVVEQKKIDKFKTKSRDGQNFYTLEGDFTDLLKCHGEDATEYLKQNKDKKLNIRTAELDLDLGKRQLLLEQGNHIIDLISCTLFMFANRCRDTSDKTGNWFDKMFGKRQYGWENGIAWVGKGAKGSDGGGLQIFIDGIWCIFNSSWDKNCRK